MEAADISLAAFIDTIELARAALKREWEGIYPSLGEKLFANWSTPTCWSVEEKVREIQKKQDEYCRLGELIMRIDKEFSKFGGPQ